MQTATPEQGGAARGGAGHALWVRLCHWILAASVLTLAYSGVVILMAHPRLYWGSAGNDLTPALIELPLGPNAKPGAWGPATPFFAATGSPVTADRAHDIFNQNGWARSLHFLMAWILVGAGTAYGLAGLITGHFRRDLIPHADELTPQKVWRDVRDHLRLPLATAPGGPPYGLLQKAAYAGVVFAALPAMVLTGLSMSPAVDAAWPLLPLVFGGPQSARTIHFAVLCLLLLFLAAHLLMVALSGFRRQIRAMTWGG